MSGERDEYNPPPFQLRSNKFVDRMMFVDLISRVVGDAGAQDYCYISMGASFLPDHHVIYRRLGIDRLISFSRDRDDIRRQEFNRPTAKMQCLPLDSGDLPDELPNLRSDHNAIIWLDFMSHKERRIQLDQSVEVLRQLRPGDLLRVTLNAEFRKFGRFDRAEGTQGIVAANRLREQIGDFLPAKLRTISRNQLPAVLAESVGLAAAKALRHREDIRIVPALSTTYADGDRMVTVTALVQPADETRLPERVRRWRYRSKTWTDLKRINVPDLSLREKYHIDRRLTYSPARIMRSLPFVPADAAAAKRLKQAIDNYKAFHRYYPAFQHVDA